MDDYDVGAAFIRTKKKKKEKTLEELAKYTWNNMNQRVGKGSYSNISIDWDYEDFLKWFISKEQVIEKIKSSGNVVSIDRIDPRKNYCESNCRLIPNELNVALGKINGLHTQLKKLYEFVEQNKNWL